MKQYNAWGEDCELSPGAVPVFVTLVDYNKSQQEVYDTSVKAGHRINELLLSERAATKVIDEIFKVAHVKDVDLSWAVERIKYLTEEYADRKDKK